MTSPAISTPTMTSASSAFPAAVPPGAQQPPDFPTSKSPAWCSPTQPASYMLPPTAAAPTPCVSPEANKKQSVNQPRPRRKLCSEDGVFLFQNRHSGGGRGAGAPLKPSFFLVPRHTIQNAPGHPLHFEIFVGQRDPALDPGPALDRKIDLGGGAGPLFLLGPPRQKGPVFS